MSSMTKDKVIVNIEEVMQMNETDYEKVKKEYVHKHSWHLAEKEYSEGVGMAYLDRVMFICPCGKSKIVRIRK